MDDATKLVILKRDLQMITAANDEYLKQLLSFAEKSIVREGIVLDDGIESGMVQVHYAAYLFRKRADSVTTMPRFLRYELNNLLFSQKVGDTE